MFKRPASAPARIRRSLIRCEKRMHSLSIALAKGFPRSVYGKIGKITDSSFTLNEIDYESGEVTGEKDLILEEGTEYTIFKLETAESENMEEIAGTKADLKEGAEVTCGYKLDGDKYVAVKIYITQIG